VVAGKGSEDQERALMLLLLLVLEAAESTIRHCQSHALAPSIGATASSEGDSVEDTNRGVVGEDTPLDGKGGRMATGSVVVAEDAAFQVARAAVAVLWIGGTELPRGKGRVVSAIGAVALPSTPPPLKANDTTVELPSTPPRAAVVVRQKAWVSFNKVAGVWEKGKTQCREEVALLNDALSPPRVAIVTTIAPCPPTPTCCCALISRGVGMRLRGRVELGVSTAVLPPYTSPTATPPVGRVAGRGQDTMSLDPEAWDGNTTVPWEVTLTLKPPP